MVVVPPTEMSTMACSAVAAVLLEFFTSILTFAVPAAFVISKSTVGLVVPMPRLPAKELFPAPVCVRRPEESVTFPEVKVKFLPEAMVVSPFKDTAPVPVPKVPLPV